MDCSREMEETVREAIMSFVGPYLQVPPMYSALKVNGKKLYELARAGKEVERQPRPVEIFTIQIEDICLPRVTMTVACSKGTYIRTLCQDIGRRVGCGGCMESLVRTRVDRFSIEESLRLGEIEHLRDLGEIEQHVLPVDCMFEALPRLTMPIEGEGDKLVHNGNPFQAELTEDGERYLQARVYDSQGCFIGIYGYDEKKSRYQPQKLFLGGAS